MTISPPTRAAVGILFLIALLTGAGQTVAQPAAAPAQAKTGAFDLTLTERSPMSAPKELARRLHLQDKDVAADYDLAKCPYKVYVPKNYDPATPHGLFVYLGYKDSPSTPEPWWPLLDEAHLIFVTPVAHTGTQYPNGVPLWQSVGLALDAVHGLKQQYNVDTHRIYLMAWRDGFSVAMGTADVFTGFVIIDPPEYYKKVSKDGRAFYPAKLPAPSGPMQSLLQGRGLFFGGMKEEFTDLMTQKVLPQDGYRHVMYKPLSLSSDLHYPNFGVEWFQKEALPFLDDAAAAEAKRQPAAVRTPRTATSVPAHAGATSTPAAPTAVSKAQRLLNLAQLYVKNGKPDLAKTKLEQLLSEYPNDPVAPQAKQLLAQLSSP